MVVYPLEHSLVVYDTAWWWWGDCPLFMCMLGHYVHVGPLLVAGSWFVTNLEKSDEGVTYVYVPPRNPSLPNRFNSLAHQAPICERGALCLMAAGCS